MSDSGKPRIRQGIQLVQHDELNAELNVVSEDEAASLLWAAQWLDEHREFAVTAIRLDNTADPNDEDDVTTTVAITLHRANRCATHVCQLMCDIWSRNGSSGPRPLAFDATHRLGGGAADHLGVAVDGVVTLPGKLPTTNP
jgi:hypothetical protein